MKPKRFRIITPGMIIILFGSVVLLVMLSCNLLTTRQATVDTPTQEQITPGLVTEIPSTLTPLSQPALETPTNLPDVPAQEAPATQESQAVQATQPDATDPGALGSCSEPVCILDGTFLLRRPIGQEGRNVIDPASRYGTMRRRIWDIYHSVQFLNSTGTPVYAAAAGDVIVAGNDNQVAYGPRFDMYGNLVILRHSLPGIPEPVYTLYANLSEVSVKVEGDVQAGEQIGLVGMSGAVSGSTLTFEVRYGENSYEAARNPELWLETVVDETGDPTGALAGRVLDRNGSHVDIRNILVQNLRRAAQGRIRPVYLRTYMEDAQTGLSPHGESFAASDLPEGTYKISFWYGTNLYEREVEVQPGKLTFVTFEVK